MTAMYVYGVTYAETKVPDSVRGIENATVTVVPQGRCGALVSELAGDRPLGHRSDLLAHEGVLEHLSQAQVPVLPFRFGAVMTGPSEVAGELLGAHQEQFLAELGHLAGRIELVVKGRYESDRAYLEVLAEDPQVLALRESIQGVPEEASYQERIRLGELVSQAMDRKRAVDGERLMQTLAPHADQVAPRRLAQEDEVATAAFLVRHERRAEFEGAIDGLGQDWAGRVRLRLIGPLPPYDFVGQLSGQAS